MAIAEGFASLNGVPYKMLPPNFAVDCMAEFAKRGSEAPVRTLPPMPIEGLRTLEVDPPVQPQTLVVTGFRIEKDQGVVSWAVPDRAGRAHTLEVGVPDLSAKLSGDELVNAAVEATRASAEALFAKLWA